MNGNGERKESPPTRRSYSPAQAAADLSFYYGLKRKTAVWTAVLAPGLALPLVFWQPWYAFALAAGGVAGVLNTLLSMHGNERLLERRSVAAFVLSSFVRIGLFGIVPGVLAVEKPSLWTLGCYFVGFFMPLALSGILVHQRDRRHG